jgi:ferredoxin-NADP reductase/ferredoxin
MYQIKLITRDAKSLSFPCEAHENIVTAAAQANIFLMAQCYAGNCGACSAHCEQGEFELTRYSEAVLSPAMQQKGQTLLCCTQPRSDMIVNLPYEYSKIRFATPRQRTAKIVNKTFLTPDTVKLELQLEEDAEGNIHFNFEPGQFVEISIPETEIKRAYSLANAPNWDGHLDFLIKLRSNGQFSTFLQQQAVLGMPLKISEAQGSFVLAERGLRPRYFIAGGCGLASVMSMLYHMAELQEPHEARLFFGVWQEEELFYQQELADLAATYPNFSYQLCVTEPNESWAGFRGSVVDALDSALKNIKSSQPDIYICGSSGLIEAVATVAENHGIAREQLIYEHYSSACDSGLNCEIKG